jgi:hypothetical protein
MTSDETIIIKNIPKDIYTKIAYQAVRYALISVAFTYNRMQKNDLISRISNITKGKIAEGLLYEYSKQIGISLDFQACATPFWMSDLRDFIWLGGEWDIKNNFIYCSDTDFENFDWTTLPALIPNKNRYDQWSKRNDTYHEESRFSAYIFTFMRLKPGRKNFFTLHISDAQYDFLSSIYAKFGMTSIVQIPFAESWFYDEWSNLGNDECIAMQYYPELIITACANARYWPLFKDTSIVDEFHYQDYLQNTPWYQKSDQILKFLNGVLVTKIRNKTCPVGLLPSFKQIAKPILG